MPKRTDLNRVLILGSGPIVIGQACEFDYYGSQACKALRAEGLEVILVNSNPATIMTDPELADRTYVEPLTPEFLAAIIESERPDAILPTVGGQTALNLAVDLANAGTLAKYNVQLIGASIAAPVESFLLRAEVQWSFKLPIALRRRDSPLLDLSATRLSQLDAGSSYWSGSFPSLLLAGISGCLSFMPITALALPIGSRK